MSVSVDNRQVVLLKSLRTNNRFYALASPERGYRNADAIDDFPEDLPLGIAYPCLEDGLNDFAVIRTTFETIDVFPDDEELRTEMMDIINDARSNLRLRLSELRDRVGSGQAHFLGTELQEFKDSIIHLVQRGAIRRTMGNMMKLDVFESVAEHEARAAGQPSEPMYRFEFTPLYDTPETYSMPPREFIARLFNDVLISVEESSNYESKYTFDRNVFQKFIAVMFVNYATTDPMFYGTNKADYGVSADRDMNQTPLYKAVAEALRVLERGETPPRPPDGFGPLADSPDQVVSIFDTLPDLGVLDEPPLAPRTVELPAFGMEQLLAEPFISITDALRLLRQVEHPRVSECSRIIHRAARQLFERLQQLEILSPMADNPMDDFEDGADRPR
jgi:hypothetical protein